MSDHLTQDQVIAYTGRVKPAAQALLQHSTAKMTERYRPGAKVVRIEQK